MRTRSGYGVGARVFHWVTVLLVFSTIPIGLVMTQELPRPTQDLLFTLHKAIGITLLLTILARLAWRLSVGAPPSPELPRMQLLAATTVHWALYALVFSMAVTGYVRVVSGGFPIEVLNAIGVPPLLPKNEALASVAKVAHRTIAWVLIGVIAIHVAAAAYHGLVRRDGVVSRMWPPFSA
jgi:cytochrome b561